MPNYTPPSSGGGGAVSSVNTRTGAVVLTAVDVGAGQLPAGVVLDSGIVIPSGADVSGILGTSGSKAAAGNDGRLSDSRTPTAHKTSHATGGSDALTAADVGATTAAAALTAAKAVSLDQFVTPAADVPWNAKKITGIANGSAAQDGAAFGQIATAVTAAKAIGPDRPPSNQGIYGKSTSGPSGQFTGITALKPIFHPIDLYGMSSFALSQLGLRVQTLLAASTIGVAIYSATYASSAHVSATLVAQLNASFSGAATGMVQGTVTTGAAGSGASVVTLDFTTTRYLIGFMASDVATLKTWGVTIPSPMTGMGIISWTGTARSSVTDWPSSFTEAANVAAISASTTIPVIDLLTATGAFFL